jgi:hypothetical protein
MPKTIDYPRTSYQSAWEVAEVVDDTGGKCSLETCARKLNRKVSGSFKAILGSAVKFGLLTSKRELLTTTNLFRRIKHAYDKQEEMLYHREAFLHPPLFTQICRKFRNRELPVHMFDIMLIREFGVEEINAQNVAKSFVEGARMAGILNERNVIADIDQLAAQQGPRRELAAGEMPLNLFKGSDTSSPSTTAITTPSHSSAQIPAPILDQSSQPATPGISVSPGFVLARPVQTEAVDDTTDPVSALFGLNTSGSPSAARSQPQSVAGPAEVFGGQGRPVSESSNLQPQNPTPPVRQSYAEPETTPPETVSPSYLVRISGPGVDTQLQIQDTEDLEIVRILLDKIRKQLKA